MNSIILLLNISIFIAAHKIDLHKLIEVPVKNPLSVGSLISGTQVLYHLIRMQYITAYLRAPFNLLLLSFKLGLFFLPFLKLYVIKT